MSEYKYIVNYDNKEDEIKNTTIETRRGCTKGGGNDNWTIYARGRRSLYKGTRRSIRGQVCDGSHEDDDGLTLQRN